MVFGIETTWLCLSTPTSPFLVNMFIELMFSHSLAVMQQNLITSLLLVFCQSYVNALVYIGQPNDECVSWFAVIVYMEHKAGLLFHLSLYFLLLELYLICFFQLLYKLSVREWILSFSFYLNVFLMTWYTLYNHFEADLRYHHLVDRSSQVFIFVAAEYETPKNSLNQVRLKCLWYVTCFGFLWSKSHFLRPSLVMFS